MQGFQMPGVDAGPLVEAQRKNLEAISHANRIAFEGAQAIAKRQSEIVRDAMQEASQAMSQVGSTESAEQRLAKQTEMAKDAFETAVKNVRELSEITRKSNNEALEIINKRVAESFDEMNKSVQQVAAQAQQATTGNGAAAAKK
jgi:phasin family protein